MRRLLCGFALLTALAGCADEAPASDPAAPAAETIAVRGVVVETLYDGQALRVDHEAMPTLGMPAMQMALPLGDAALADGLTPGDKVALTIEAAPRLRVTAVDRLPADTPLALAAPTSRVASDSTAAADSLATQ